MKKGSLELRVGLFVILALTGLTVLVLKTGDFYLKPGYTVHLVFDFVSGIDDGSPVHLAGVDVGKIMRTDVVRDVSGETHVELTAWIREGIVIEEDAAARINTLGLLGEKYVEILPGTPGAKLISDGGILRGSKAVVLEDLTEAGNRLIGEIESAFKSVNQVVSDPQFRYAAKNTFIKASDTFDSASVVSGNLVGVSEDFKQTSKDLKDAAASAKVVLERLKNGEGTVGYLLKNDKMARDLEDFAADIKQHPWKLFTRK